MAAVIENRILCMHGGISPELLSLDHIRRIERPTEIPTDGLLCDLLWSDPDIDTRGYGINDRGVSYLFGAEVIRELLVKLDLDLICRGH